jgi:hypothetical protein
MVGLLMLELGFERRGKNIVAACERAVDAYLKKHETERFHGRRSRPSVESAAHEKRPERVVGQPERDADQKDMTRGWHYHNGTRATGPLTWSQLWKLARRGEIGSETRVWHSAYGGWRRASEISGLMK